MTVRFSALLLACWKPELPAPVCASAWAVEKLELLSFLP